VAKFKLINFKGDLFATGFRVQTQIAVRLASREGNTLVHQIHHAIELADHCHDSIRQDGVLEALRSKTFRRLWARWQHRSSNRIIDQQDQ
jgi:hypothetical protein